MKITVQSAYSTVLSLHIVRIVLHGMTAIPVTLRYCLHACRVYRILELSSVSP